MKGTDIWDRIHGVMAGIDGPGSVAEDEEALRLLWRRRAAEFARPPAGIDEDIAWEKLVILRIGKERYAFRVDYVEEIMRVPDITPVPCVPPHFSGVINRRGTILPLVDLRIFFGGLRTDLTSESRIVVLSDGMNTLGFLVDGADRILPFPGQEIKPPLRRGDGVHEEFCEGVLTLDRRMILLLDAKRLLQDDKMKVDKSL